LNKPLRTVVTDKDFPANGLKYSSDMTDHTGLIKAVVIQRLLVIILAFPHTLRWPHLKSYVKPFATAKY